jgi:hypothetical protein
MEKALAEYRRQQIVMSDGAPSLESEVERLTGLQPNVQRSSILPFYSQETGLVAPQFVYDAAKAVVAPGFTAQGGRVSPEEAFNVAANITGGSIGGSALAPVEGAIAGMGASRKTPKVSYERRQEGPFLRIRQTGAGGTPTTDVGAGKTPQRTPQGGNVRGGQSLAVAPDNAPQGVFGRGVRNVARQCAQVKQNEARGELRQALEKTDTEKSAIGKIYRRFDWH